MSVMSTEKTRPRPFAEAGTVPGFCICVLTVVRNCKLLPELCRTRPTNDEGRPHRVVRAAFEEDVMRRGQPSMISERIQRIAHSTPLVMSAFLWLS